VQERVELDPDHGHDPQEVEVDHQQEEEPEGFAVGGGGAGEAQVERKDQRKKFEEGAGQERPRPDPAPPDSAVGDHRIEAEEEQEAGPAAHQDLEQEGDGAVGHDPGQVGQLAEEPEDGGADQHQAADEGEQ
jgi:hypothetical protein